MLEIPDSTGSAVPAATAVGRSKRQRSRATLLVQQLLFYSVILGTWQLLVALGVIDPFYLPAPTAIGQEFWALLLEGRVIDEASITFLEMIVGLVIGATAGVTCGLAVVRVSWAWGLLQPLVYFAYALPRIALAPLFIVAFGLGIWSKIATVIFAVFFILLLNTVAGANDVGREYVQAARALGASDGQVLRRVIVPGTLAWIFSGLRLAASLAFLSAVVAEFVGSTGGLGYQLQLAATYFDTVGIYTWMLVLGICALLLNAVVGVVERHLLRWRPQSFV